MNDSRCLLIRHIRILKVVDLTDRLQHVYASVEDGQASLPCDLRLYEASVVEHVVWTRVSTGEIIYRLDGRRSVAVRGVFASPHHVTSPAWTGRSFFSLARQPATLKIARLELNDSDEYTCEVSHADGTTLTHRLVFTVILPSGAPEIIDANGQSIENNEVGPLTINETVRLTCRVRQGVPLPTVRWDLGSDDRTHEVHELGTPDSTNTNLEKLQGWVASRLTLSHLQRSDLNRKLKCIVQQAAVEAFTTTIEVTLDINPQTGDDENQLSEWEELEAFFQDDFDGNLTFSVLMLEARREFHERILRCVASHPRLPHLTRSASTKLNIYYSPEVQVSIRGGHGDLAVNEGDDVYLECTFSANPEPHTVLWYHDGQVLPEYLVPMTTGPYLILKNAKPKHSGNYTCSVANLLGNATSGPARLQVKYRPRCVSLWKFGSSASLPSSSRNLANPGRAQRLSGQDLTDEVRLGCELDCDDGAKCDFIWDVFDIAGERVNIQPISEEPVKTASRHRSRLAQFSIPRRYNQHPLRVECRGQNGIGITQVHFCSLEIPPALQEEVDVRHKDQCVLLWDDQRNLVKANKRILVTCPPKRSRIDSGYVHLIEDNGIQRPGSGGDYTYALEIFDEFGHVVDRLTSPEPRFALEAGSRWRDDDGSSPQIEKLFLRIIIPSTQKAMIAEPRSKAAAGSSVVDVAAIKSNQTVLSLCCSSRGQDLAQVLLKPRSEPLATSNAFAYAHLQSRNA
ncbi:hemicentin-2-like [Tropilaelaps mercedesae]|uniref:Hemicentin-2-like n=1 Tax=Tropilaelaps mercedesae TaxID=418985 RepID=A0A1V9Y0J5_9ACAR|nr:hemicentin-2-like [Tropilaelaps mercedesae]